MNSDLIPFDITFPPSDSAVVQVFAIVNGTKWINPSIGGVKWLKVSPTMAGQSPHRIGKSLTHSTLKLSLFVTLGSYI